MQVLEVCVNKLIFNAFEYLIHAVEYQKVPIRRQSQVFSEVLNVKHEDASHYSNIKHAVLTSKFKVGLFFWRSRRDYDLR